MGWGKGREANRVLGWNPMSRRSGLKAGHSRGSFCFGFFSALILAGSGGVRLWFHDAGGARRGRPDCGSRMSVHGLDR